jgi:hypothetical protein
MLIKTKLKVHSHNGKIVTFVGQVDVEWAGAVGIFEVSENSFWVSEDVLWTNETSHGSLDAHDGGFSGDGS